MTLEKEVSAAAEAVGELIAVVERLRGEDGCPWDRAQTHESLRRYLIEETYEVAEAIDHRDPLALREELGDLLLQIIFHAELEREAGGFSMREVAEDEARKMVQRTLLSLLCAGDLRDRMRLKTRVKEELSRFLFQKTGRRPMVLPVIMSV